MEKITNLFADLSKTENNLIHCYWKNNLVQSSDCIKPCWSYDGMVTTKECKHISEWWKIRVKSIGIQKTGQALNAVDLQLKSAYKELIDFLKQDGIEFDYIKKYSPENAERLINGINVIDGYYGIKKDIQGLKRALNLFYRVYRDAIKDIEKRIYL